jgi:hypothetical protein
MATLDWPECTLVEVIPCKVSGAPLLRNTHLPVEAITGTMTLSAMRDYRRSPLRKRRVATRKAASTLLEPFSTIGPSINFRRSFESPVR